MTPRSILRRHPAAVAILAGAVLVVAACLPSGSREGPSGSPDQIATPSPTPAGPTGPTASPSFVRPTPTPQPTFLVYQVRPGDTLIQIAKRFGTDGRSIAYWNRSTYPNLDPESSSYRPDRLEVGWTLLIVPNATFDEQTLPEPSELIGPSPSATPSDEESAGDETEEGPSEEPSGSPPE
ncbi:MAG TPA: LysM domain-containing protein [Candidatus Limnocylindrales bacterium]|jgi:Tfp pilus assembly protein FimV